MEMVKARLIAAAVAALALCPAALAQHTFSWETFPMDGHRAGVSIPGTDNIAEALGVVEDGVYTAPNGVRYKGGATAAVAQLLIDAQPAMASVKTVVGVCPGGMSRKNPALGNMIVDRLMMVGERETGIKVDLGLINRGGLRCDLPDGTVILDDILSMLPFKNCVNVVTLKGSDLLKLFEDMARNKMQIIGGAEAVVRGHKLVSLKIKGQKVQRGKLYNLATIDFLLDGGDGIYAARNAVSLASTPILIKEVLLEYVADLTAQGLPITYDDTSRITYLEEDKK